MRFEALTNRVEIVVRLRKDTGRVMDDVYVRFSVDQYGHVDVDLPHRTGEDSHERNQRYRDALDILIEEFGVAEWQRIGPGDSEPFLTPEWMERTAEQRATLGAGWQELPLPESIVDEDDPHADLKAALKDAQPILVNLDPDGPPIIASPDHPEHPVQQTLRERRSS